MYWSDWHGRISLSKYVQSLKEPRKNTIFYLLYNVTVVYGSVIIYVIYFMIRKVKIFSPIE